MRSTRSSRKSTPPHLFGSRVPGAEFVRRDSLYRADHREPVATRLFCRTHVVDSERMYDGVHRMVCHLRDAVASLEPAQLDGSEAARLLELFTTAERVCAAGRTLLARRVEQTNIWQREGYRTAAGG